MTGDPLSVFLSLLTVCVRDDDGADSRLSLLAFTAVSFAIGVATSGLTLYLLSAAHLVF
jgi:hypothetical protein